MVFNSFVFVFFFVVVTTLFFAVPQRFRWFLLVVASCYFYMYFIPVYILILAVTIVVDYFAGILIFGAQGSRRKGYLVVSVVANVGFLMFFKYYNFFTNNLVWLSEIIGFSYTIPALKIVLPVGLSFHTFQAMSYTIEVYRGRQLPERHFGIYTLYVLFYPQLVAGPIERPQNLLPQFRQAHRFRWEQISEGMKLILWGLFKKVVVADRLAIYVDAVYDNYSKHSGTSLLLATYFFAFQIYCDFSGYSDIARGCARVMGMNLMVNFNRPYYAKSIAEFWSRWHISLSTWFRDYLYIPLGGNRVGRLRWYRNLAVVFLISGFWHGANWTFVWWGGIHALALIIGILTRPIRDRVWRGLPMRWGRMRRVLAMVMVFHIVTFAWIFFRSPDMSTANVILMKILWGLGDPFFWGERAHLIYGFAAIAILFYYERPHTGSSIVELLQERTPAYRMVTYVVLVTLITLIGVTDGEQFIYFQF